VLKLFCDEGYELVSVIRQEGFKDGLSEYFGSFKNIIDWASIIYSTGIFVLFVIWAHILKDFRDLLMTANSNVEGSWPSSGDIFTASNPDYWQDVDNMVEYYHSLLNVCAFYPLVIGARFFSSFSSQPRLGLVTATLGSAAKDILHFLVVLSVTLVIFCQSGQFLFGVEVDEFESFGRTFMSVFRAMLGDFDYLALAQVGRLPANLWWLLFVVLVNMIMLNMLLVIIMDVYGNIKSSLASDDEENFPTIWSQTYEILGRWRLQLSGQALSISRVLRELEDKEDNFYKAVDNREQKHEKLVTISTFMENVRGLKKRQAQQIMEQAYDWYELQNKKNESVEDVLDHLRSVDLRVQRVQQVTDSMGGSQAAREFVDIAQARRVQLLLKARDYAQETLPSVYLVQEEKPEVEPEDKKQDQPAEGACAPACCAPTAI